MRKELEFRDFLPYTRDMDNSKPFHKEVYQPESGTFFTEVTYYGTTTGLIGSLRVDHEGVDFITVDKVIPLHELAAVIQDCKESASEYVFRTYDGALARNPSEAARILAQQGDE